MSASWRTSRGTPCAAAGRTIRNARGGADDETNFATKCYACNDARGDYLLEELGWTLRAVSTTPDGLRGSWQRLARQRSRDGASHPSSDTASTIR